MTVMDDRKKRSSVGDMDDARLGRLIDLVVEAKKLPRKPSVREVFDQSFSAGCRAKPDARPGRLNRLAS